MSATLMGKKSALGQAEDSATEMSTTTETLACVSRKESVVNHVLVARALTHASSAPASSISSSMNFINVIR